MPPDPLSDAASLRGRVIANGIELGNRPRQQAIPVTTRSCDRSSRPLHGPDKECQNRRGKHAVIWSVSNLVPLKQFKPNEIKIVYYENLCTQPETELPAIFGSIGRNYEALTNDAVSRPSQTTRVTSVVVDGTDKISSWKKNLSATQIENILRVVNAFGLGYVYGESLLRLSQNAI